MIVVKKETPLQTFLGGLSSGFNMMFPILGAPLLSYFLNKDVEQKITNPTLDQDTLDKVNSVLKSSGVDLTVNSLEDFEKLKDIDNETAKKLYSVYSKSIKNIQDFQSQNNLRKGIMLSNPNLIGALDLNQNIAKAITNLQDKQAVENVVKDLPDQYKSLLLTDNQKVYQLMLLKTLLGQQQAQQPVGGLGFNPLMFLFANPFGFTPNTQGVK